jgi:hypothetical protein
MKHVIDAEGKRLPIKLDATSNGEFVPVPLSPTNRAANRRAHEAATENAKRLGVSRRRFLISACGAATALLAFNSANAAAGKGGCFFEIEPDAAVEPQWPRHTLTARGEFFRRSGPLRRSDRRMGENSASRCVQVVAESKLQIRRETRRPQLSRLPWA